MLTLKSVEVQNFRSIVGTPLRMDFGDLTAIVGPNNSGKSNILRALNLFFTGEVEGAPYTTDLDYPKGGSLSKGDQTKITVTVSYEARKEVLIARALDELEAESTQRRLDDELLSLRLSYSKHGVESWQFIGKLGVKNINRNLIEKVRDAVRQSVAFKYIPVGRDSLESINREIGTELIRTIFSGWSGATKSRREINAAIEVLLEKLQPELESTSTSVTESVREVFKEIRHLKLRLPFSNLEEMLPSLTAVISDTAETGVRSKGAGIQTSSLIFLLKFLADNHPQRHNARVTFIWAIEEPESFLHPSKQREMASVMAKFAQEVQTVITTHCPHFVIRDGGTSSSWVVDKHSASPHSTYVVGKDYELARQTLGVSLLDSMTLFPLNIVVEGPSDEILLSGTLKKLASDFQVPPYDVRFFPAGSASSATYLFESLRAYSDGETTIRLIIDGDNAGVKALSGLLGRAKRDGTSWKANSDYFQLPVDTENLCSDRVKRALAKERPAQVELVEDTNDNITAFAFRETFKRGLAERAVELSATADLGGFKRILGRVLSSIPSKYDEAV
jgi:putative ATP-dependent endonuclease of the OLD family